MRECSTLLCPHWTAWKDQSECPVTCGKGYQTKQRNCINGEPGVTPECQGKSIIVAECNDFPCPFWSEWEMTNECSKTCGGGVTQLTRECVNGTPGKDLNCMGETETLAECAQNECPYWSEWTEWRDCSTTCDAGTSYRDRNVQHVEFYL